jgi:hypothetical protein
MDVQPGLCYYCTSNEPLKGLSYCDVCRKQLQSNREAFLKQVVAKLDENIRVFTVLSADPTKYRISKNARKDEFDEYAKTKFTSALMNMQQKRGEILSDLGLNKDKD